jgi:adenosine deaminase
MINASIPFIDLHRHLDGSVRLETILAIGQQFNLPLPGRTLEELRPHVQVVEPQPGIMAFLQNMKWLTAVMVNYEACRRIAYENVLDAKREGIDYIELRFSPWFMAETHHLNAGEVTRAVIDGIKAGQKQTGVKVNIIGILSRSYGPEACWKELESLLSCRQDIIALDLAGDEANWHGSLFTDHFKKARDAGWKITIHAGEAAGHENIWQALTELKADRIGHGIRAIDDPALMNFLVEKQIGLENNLTSNVQTGLVSSYQEHPLKTFIERGILATINTDDPGISGIDLPYEYQVAAPAAGLSLEQIQIAQENALKIAFLNDDEKSLLREKKSPIFTKGPS